MAWATLLAAAGWTGCSSPDPVAGGRPAAAAPAVDVTRTAAAVEAPVPPAARSVSDILTRAAAQPAAQWPGEGWRALFDGRSLEGWLEIPYAGRGELELRNGLLVMGMGSPFTGIRYTNAFPKMNYEIAVEAMRVTGSDFFCGLTVPVGDSHCSLIVGGWGGGLVGISSLDGYDASENETTKFMGFEKGRWYRIRMRVTEERLEAWIDEEQVVNVDTRGRRISVRPGDIEECIPLGIACWQTMAAIREVRWRPVTGPASPLKGGR
ncbi:3-keto-disaccharide hydrolase [Limisphaera sp. VF-2]|jgi:hypothetical protein|uniref:3-keto-disaccharide hydrolase n=1 Tax=Limisphaera sp. VF-2 TaxID=3400418 RepID=UPI001750391F